MINSSDMKRGVLLDLDGAPWQIIDCAFQSPSARGASTITKIKIKNLKTGNVLSKSYRGGEMIPTADCEKRAVQFLYKDGDDYAFMDEENYDQFTLSAEILGDGAGYLTDGLGVRSLLYNGDVINVELPNTVDLEVTDTAPALKGATAQAQLKPATLETGIQVLVPPYLTIGEKIRVDTREGKFVSRVNE
ncbi:MAG: elongation factor P [Deltaproteobacteria bacterium]|nr:elongation factor P [Deltaproteobacteria bacterium]